jgi:hypothetical protein
MKNRILPTFLLSSLCTLCTLCLCGDSSAALDPELKTPYQLKVVLHFADNRLLTPVFCDRVERELRDGLQASFGDLVNVEVTREHPRLNEVLQNGLKSLDNWHERSPVKTHFVMIDYSGVHYEIQARQFDGLPGRPSPEVRRDHTRDREFVAKTAALLIDQDFGLAGTFDVWPPEEKPGQDKPVVVHLKGAGLGASLDRWIKKGDVFSVRQMPAGDSSPGTPVRDAVLIVETPPAGADSTCLCRPFRRYPLAGGGAGYRCIKLGTVSAPLHLRLRQALALDRDGPLKDVLSVQIRRHGFDNEPMTQLQKQTDTFNAVDTTGDKDGSFKDVAFVTVVSSDGKTRARVPVPILDDQPVVLAVNVSDDAGSELAFKKTAWERDVTQAWQEQNELFREINEGAKTDKRAEIMAKIEEGQKRLQSEVIRLTAEQMKVKAGEADREIIDRLKQVGKGETELSTFLATLKKIDKEEHDPQKKEWLAQVLRGKQMEADLELGKAIALYDEMLKTDAPNEKLRDDLAKHLVDLHKEWDPKSDAHREARAFIYEVWPKMDDAGLLEKIPDAKKAYEVCKGVKDRAGLSRLFKGTEAHAVRMGQELKDLLPDTRTDDEIRAKNIQDLSKRLADLARDVKAAFDAAGK